MSQASAQWVAAGMISLLAVVAVAAFSWAVNVMGLNGIMGEELWAFYAGGFEANPPIAMVVTCLGGWAALNVLWYFGDLFAALFNLHPKGGE